MVFHWSRQMKKTHQVLEPVKAALSGVALTFRTQRHMRFHIYTVGIVVLLALFLGLGPREWLVLLFTVVLVLTAEMFNSAIEATVDLVQPSYHPLAKTAKDIAAGAVLITTTLSLVVGAVLIIGDARWESIKANLTSEGFGPPFMLRFILGAVLVMIVIVIGKGLGKRGQVFKGGLVSGHSAYAFFVAMGIMALTDLFLVSALGILLASVVAQSRWEAKIHTIFELSLGALCGTIVGLLVFVVVPK
jgi:diacylglycerol kinase (ATP)